MTEMQSQAPLRAPEPQEPEGIGGWLILPIIHLAGNSALILYEIVAGFIQATPEGEAMPDAGTSAQNLGDAMALMSSGEKLAVGFFFFSIFVVLYAAFA